MKKVLPQIRFVLSEADKNPHGKHFHIYRDQIGNIELKIWKYGEDNNIALKITDLREIKRLRDWLTRIIDYLERK